MPITSILTRTATKVGRSTLTSLVLTTALAVATPAAVAQEDDAKAILKAMADYVSSQQTIELSFDSAIEIITPEIEKIQFASSGTLLLSRPDKLKASRTGGYADVELVFDGESVSVLGKGRHLYTQFEGPETVDALIDILRVRQGLALPGADLLLSNVYEALIAGVLEAKHIGRGVIGGVECEHLAFRNQDTDWQLWVEVGENPVPRKLVITSKTVNSAPQYSLQITDWKTGVEPAADAFVFTPQEGAEQVEVEALVELDELPPAAAPDTDDH
ncbi:DUF2092 domain-containing protein [Rhabdochromatium marinum]|uniref:DUF2092 domain-containing protein n=1 Tax=Rhabdochromatium marinum TaxID=48729 RepID=UPI001902F4C1|nr:DUF2092 domain-containing protein [Rhabdochromatium marinum]MBK1648761.1 hypothetical protein [Rhabdochromatium marinum]